jgi:opacity protein-like surface antigen
MRTGIRALCVVAAVLGSARPVSAEWLLTPFIGLTAGGRTGYFDPDDAVSRTKPAFGVAVTRVWGRFAAEGEIAGVPGFFTAGDGGLITSSSLLSVSGNVIITQPFLSGLKPYAVAGIGAIHVRVQDTADVFSVSEWQPLFTLGGGVLVPVTRHLRVRGDARYRFSRRSDGAGSTIGFGTLYVDFWRISAGVSVGF